MAFRKAPLNHILCHIYKSNRRFGNVRKCRDSAQSRAEMIIFQLPNRAGPCLRTCVTRSVILLRNVASIRVIHTTNSNGGNYAGDAEQGSALCSLVFGTSMEK